MSIIQLIVFMERGKDWVDFQALTEQAVKDSGAEKIMKFYQRWDDLVIKGSEARAFSFWRQGDKNRQFSLDLKTGRWNDFGGLPLVIAQVRKRFIGLIQVLEYAETGRVCKEHQAGLILRDILALQMDTNRDIFEISAIQKPTENVPFGKAIRGLRTKNVEYFKANGVTQKTARSFGAGVAFRGLHKGRVCFPIKAPNGTIMAYAGRATSPDMLPYPFRFPCNRSGSSSIWSA